MSQTFFCFCWRLRPTQRRNDTLQILQLQDEQSWSGLLQIVWESDVFFKMAQSRPLLFIFVFFKFLWQIYDLNYIKHRWCALDSNPGGRIEGADEYTELWQHPKSVCCLADWEASLKKCQWAIGTPLKSISVEFYFSRIVFSDSKLVRINWTRVRNYS